MVKYRRRGGPAVLRSDKVPVFGGFNPHVYLFEHLLGVVSGTFEQTVPEKRSWPVPLSRFNTSAPANEQHG